MAVETDKNAKGLLDELLESAKDATAPRQVLAQAVNASALLLAAGWADRACAALEAMLPDGADEPDFLNNLACVNLAAGKAGRAVSLLERASRLAPTDVLIAANLDAAKRQAGAGR